MSKKQPKKKAAPKESQSERFKRAATQAGADETGREFERAFKAIVRPKKAPSSKA